jgi:uncharacterized protein (TIGR02996 family)
MAGARQELLALLQAARAHPDDLNRRLILADWLDEHGDDSDRARAEVVRGQCERARLSPYEERSYDLLAREGELLNQHAPAWLGPLARFPVTFHHGLLRLEVTTEQLLSPDLVALAGTETWAWVETLHLSSVAEEHGPALGASPLLKSITGLDLSGVMLTPGSAAMLGRCPALAGLVEVSLNGTSPNSQQSWPSAGWLEAVISSPSLPPLASLDLTSSNFPTPGAELLVSSPLLRGLTRLILDHNRFGKGPVIALASSKSTDNLQVLGLADTFLWPDVVRALARSKHLGNLRKLDLSDNDLPPAIAGTLASSAAWPRLESLNLARNGKMGVRAARLLAEKPWSYPLRELNLAGVGLGDTGLRTLAGAPHMRSLAVLDLFANTIGQDGVAALAESPHFAGLVDLSLNANEFGSPGLAALARSPHLAGLKRLSLEWCRIGQEGIEALAASSSLAGLVDLTLSCGVPVEPSALGGDGVLPNLRKLALEDIPWNAEMMAQFLDLSFIPQLRDLRLGWLSPEAVVLLAGSSRLADLTVLTLQGLPPETLAAHHLANAPHLRRLTVLDLAHSSITPSGAQALLTSANLPCLRRLLLTGDQPNAFVDLRRRFGERLHYTPFDYGAGEVEADVE